MKEKDIFTLKEWCKENIQSNFSENSLKDIENLFNAYERLNSETSLSTIFDTDLDYNVLHQASKLGFDCFIANSLVTYNGDVSQLLMSKSKSGNTPLHVAALFGNLPALEILLDRCPNAANEFNQAGKLPIHLAAVKNKMDEKLNCVKKLLPKTNKKALTHEDNAGMSLLLSLVAFDNIQIMEDILKEDPKLISLSDMKGQNILHLAIIQQCPKLLDHFLSNKQLMMQTTSNNSTTLHLACRYGEENVIRKVLKETPENSRTIKDEHSKQPSDYIAQRSSKFSQSLLDEFDIPRNNHVPRN
ncbi:MAG: ankyrin repeat domain-containing protein [Legionella sp.]|uniref:ankyrin repeat domain-containing protein n=1 Tax=Legionella sp. TaxID=459 RepID=UPI0039E5FA97